MKGYQALIQTLCITNDYSESINYNMHLLCYKYYTNLLSCSFGEESMLSCGIPRKVPEVIIEIVSGYYKKMDDFNLINKCLNCKHLLQRQKYYYCKI